MGKNILKTIYGVFVILVFWTVLYFIIESSVIPSPISTFTHFFKNFTSEIIWHLGASLYRITIAIVLSVVIGLPVGIIMGMTKAGDAFISPVVYLAYPIPKIAFIPVFMILFGIKDASKIFLVFTVIVFQIAIGVRDGIKEISPSIHLAAKSLGLNFKDNLLNVILPGSLPKLFSALRISSGIAISALFLSENYATTYGIGYYIMNNWIMVDYKAMFSGIIGLSLMGYWIFKLIDLAQAKFCPWQKN